MGRRDPLFSLALVNVPLICPLGLPARFPPSHGILEARSSAPVSMKNISPCVPSTGAFPKLTPGSLSH